METASLVYKNEHLELEMKIMKYRHLVRDVTLGPEAEKRVAVLIAELEQKLREIDE